MTRPRRLSRPRPPRGGHLGGGDAPRAGILAGMTATRMTTQERTEADDRLLLAVLDVLDAMDPGAPAWEWAGTLFDADPDAPGR
ncbi:hypothetical protein [Actinocorallia sp. A-T 12471]|uniref:hypothetical protein n=1 Tax=Actinocorallia sp. A-T 12471 TaxID=3089813 RepID=UPI0029CB5F61|nr:hypothetical protein [Actinocorallia sp. A-T 12471]MDX6742338.1 hypothetical protein [Actinocorallia sp. A-T 12471]